MRLLVLAVVVSVQLIASGTPAQISPSTMTIYGSCANWQEDPADTDNEVTLRDIAEYNLGLRVPDYKLRDWSGFIDHGKIGTYTLKAKAIHSTGMREETAEFTIIVEDALNAGCEDDAPQDEPKRTMDVSPGPTLTPGGIISIPGPISITKRWVVAAKVAPGCGVQPSIEDLCKYSKEPIVDPPADLDAANSIAVAVKSVARLPLHAGIQVSSPSSCCYLDSATYATLTVYQSAYKIDFPPGTTVQLRRNGKLESLKLQSLDCRGAEFECNCCRTLSAPQPPGT